jgi:hypothetical protein
MANPPPKKDSKTEENWWPSPLAHLRDADPWAEADIVVAEIQSFDDGPHTGHRHLFSALVPIADIEEVKKKLAEFDHEVQASGPRPWASPEHPYTPNFWMGTESEGLLRRTYGPLVLSWRSHDKTVLQLDPGFAMTYGLAPRSLSDGETRWDDPMAPRYDIARVTAPSVWDFPSGTHAFVTIRKDYLQDYLTLRQMALVHGYWEMRWSETDEEIEARLGSQEAIEIKLPDRHFMLRRSWDDKKIVAAQVWGARVVALPGALPISENDLEKNGLLWPGFKEPLTDADAMRMSVGDVVYVKDTVLGGYEGRPEFRINPNSGSVTFGTQWSVGFCDRVGRDLVQLEIKKLYEGVPPHITREWHSHAVAPPSKEALQRLQKERHVGMRAEEIVYAAVALGESLSRLAGEASLPGLQPEDFVNLRRKALDYQGWWTFPHLEPIGRHIPPNITEDDFLNRCMSLNKIVTEGLSEKDFRLILRSVGVPPEPLEKLRALKLLDCIVRMAQIAEQAGLDLPIQGKEVWRRLEKDGTVPARPIDHLFALYELRVLAGHKASKRHERVLEELKRFGVFPSRDGTGYGLILDRIYDLVIGDLGTARAKIDAALAICNPLVTPAKAPPPKPAQAVAATSPATRKSEEANTNRRRRWRGRRGGRRNRRDQPTES